MNTQSKPRLTGRTARDKRPVRLATALVAGALVACVGPYAVTASAAATSRSSAPRATTTSGSYVAVTPARLTDTRPNSGQTNAGKAIAAGATLTVQVTGKGNVATGASAAVLNVTAVDPTAAGFLTVFPSGTTMPVVSNLNFTPGAVVANLVTVPVSASGAVSIYNSAGSTNVVVDVDGYYMGSAAANGSGLYNPVSPTRVLGSLQAGQPIGPGAATAVTVASASPTDNVPATATAVVLNVTSSQASAASFLTVYPAGVARPLASNVNFTAGETVANRVTVGVGTGGQIEVFNGAGTARVDVDVSGYYTGSGGTGSVFVPITPIRITDTRSRTNGTPIAANSSERFALAGGSIPSSAIAVAANFTVVAGSAAGYLTVYPASDAQAPVASDVNWLPRGVVPNLTLADTSGSGGVEVYNSQGAAVDVVIDAFGYFATAP